eukprot:CAMPEP_0173100684 /NCGR_PEP_ID=MMETSP1102-20130122/36360_1 /TAXON_ID=49646 /ORGANISM="Geminigera sp., Strain Caron Lab Isolate" /LENGTH=175 /DNA_ID=CAMNT_0013994193 /DNA_START=91 /DNA_END=618 /DNA_ORIENTATION=+
MSYVDVLALEVDEPTAKFNDEIKFTITFQCKMKPAEDLVWKIVWVSSAKDENLDQVLDEVDVPPDVGINKFDFVVDPPDTSKIPAGDVLGVTVIMVQAWYKEKEFLRVGYYVKVQYAEEPRVTRYLIEWDDVLAAAPTPEGPSSPGTAAAAAGVATLGAVGVPLNTTPPAAGACS